MKKFIGPLVVLAVLLISASFVHAAYYDVYALENSSIGGSGLSTINLTAGQLFTVSVDESDLWNAGALPRWSNADGLVADLFATGSDESGRGAGTLIGEDFGLYTAGGLSAPFGSLVGKIDSGDFFLIGTAYSGTAPNAGTLMLYYWDSGNTDNTQFVSADVNAVPIPGAALLFGSSIIGIAGIRRRLKR